MMLWLTGCSSAPLLVTNAVVTSVDEETSYFESQGRPIRVDVYKPDDSERHPAVILLHGSSGIHSLIPGPIPRYAKTLAHDGIVALVVHYFDATGDYTVDDSEEKANYFRWAGVVKDAVTWARGRPDVISGRVGLLGHSLGAWLAVGAAALDRRIDRIVLFGAGLEPFLADRIRRMPPTLIFHGDEDDVVPLADASRLAEFLQSHGWRVNLRVFHGEGHSFSDAAAADALAQTARFLGVRTPVATRPMQPSRGFVRPSDVRGQPERSE
jgi:carboxymethylenebutenolidase